MSQPDLPRSEIRRRRRERSLIAFLTLAVMALTYLTVAPQNLLRATGHLPSEANLVFFALVNLNLLLIILLAFLVLRNLVKLVFERRSRVLGARLKTRLVVAFFSFGIVPTAMLFIGAWAFMSKSIESWFSLPLDQSLKASLSVAQVYYRSAEGDAKRSSKQIGRAIVGAPLPLDPAHRREIRALVERKRIEYDLASVDVYSADGTLLARVSDPELPVEKFPPPSDKLLRQAFSNQREAQMQDLKRGMIVTGLSPIRPPNADGPLLGVVVTRDFVPESLLGKMRLISRTHQEFRQVRVLEGPIRTIYLTILTAITLVVILLSSWFGFFLAKGISVPLQALAEGTEAIARGRLDFQIPQASDDEFGVLVDSFNKMTRDLRASDEALKRSNLELERRRKYMEVVLSSVAAGVVAIDRDGLISTINRNAEKLLNIRVAQTLGKHFTDVLPPDHQDTVREMIREIRRLGRETLARQVTVPIGGQALTLLVSLTLLRDEEGRDMGVVAVFEDLTHVIKAQRALAWREVARRIAHEIKNPLTPIQLSAQRLRKRYLGKLQGEDVGIFDECTATIVKQVEELKNLVNEFSNFARLPAANPQPSDLNGLVEEGLFLFQEAHKNIQFSFLPAAGLPLVNLDREQIKRVLINLLDNAVAAIGGEAGLVEVVTDHDPALQVARLEVADNGIGIRPEDRGRLFEPYFSTKKSGTGLGLAIVSKIVADHNGYIRVRDNEPRGTRFVIELPV
jgi:two-component system nitrogen regulation sensor histidine kinase NtrY